MQAWSPLNVGAWRSRLRKARQVIAARQIASARPELFPVRAMDVGARHGPIGVWAWAHRIGLADLLLVEPDPDEAARLRTSWPKATVIDIALDRDARTRTLHITDEPGRSSFLRPLRPVGPFEVVRTIDVPTAPLTQLDTGRIDFVKLDVQGFELEVLAGCGDLLASVIGVEIEVSFRPTYEHQPGFGDIHRQLTSDGFSLLDIRPFAVAGQVEEADAFYGRLSDDPRLAFWRSLRGVPTEAQFQHRL